MLKLVKRGSGPSLAPRRYAVILLTANLLVVHKNPITAARSRVRIWYYPCSFQASQELKPRAEDGGNEMVTRE